MENTGKGFGLRFLNRYYLITWRRQSIRRWRRAAARREKPKTVQLRCFLFICAAGICLLAREGGFKYLAVRVRYIEDIISAEHAGSEPDIHGEQGSSTVKEGISILLDEGSVNIFRVEEHAETE